MPNGKQAQVVSFVGFYVLKSLCAARIYHVVLCARELVCFLCAEAQNLLVVERFCIYLVEDLSFVGQRVFKSSLQPAWHRSGTISFTHQFSKSH